MSRTPTNDIFWQRLGEMAKNILNMVLWHPEMEMKFTKIIYIHRGAKNNLKKINGDSVERLEGGFLILKDGTQIPFHRIRKIEYKDKILWKR